MRGKPCVVNNHPAMTAERQTRLDAVLARRQPDLTIYAENLHKPRNFSAMVR